MTLDALTIGETMVLFVAETPGPLARVERFGKRLAGADSNVAIGLARLGLRVGWVSRLGGDSFGTFVRECIEREGVDCSRVALDAQRSTGFMLKSRAESGADPVIEYHRRGSAASVLAITRPGAVSQHTPPARDRHLRRAVGQHARTDRARDARCVMRAAPCHSIRTCDPRCSRTASR